MHNQGLSQLFLAVHKNHFTKRKQKKIELVAKPADYLVEMSLFQTPPEYSSRFAPLGRIGAAAVDFAGPRGLDLNLASVG